MQGFILLILGLIIVITFHECAHALVAFWLGDPTAKRAGRISLNPIKHLDPMGFLMIFLIGIGWGKPVPVNPAFFKKPRMHEALVAVAGPVANLILAIIAGTLVKNFGRTMPELLAQFLVIIFDISIVLFAFNMLPFPPLDGSKFLQIIIPRRWQLPYQSYLAHASLYFIVFLLLDNFIISKYVGISIFGWLIGWIEIGVKSLIFLGS